LPASKKKKNMLWDPNRKIVFEYEYIGQINIRKETALSLNRETRRSI
jgi:hypothetical protein